ncbi:ThiF family adenylyltransferase [Acinetobacter baumannii]|uniref:ThiF family adenylyltransferase n=1 Tax=Acinetobacter baumannii TaxID=470 RepID=UPI00044879FB|nr:ThiF family adenylyltransferase [Acinetobacter baumannii]EKT9890764.1 ThiF family adenylyltransferase [Acinetobacter baumannii]EKT9963591.1 ThiF family adenylyltransferase [Acinetobacter baumannii]EKW3630591.1 ThiF family adenylyltransferase [Acinetobacter baumannii]EKW3729420.1 ThiF family adenylyltransferase [Acinetobacter baumannii]EKW5782742.1 ThiF family adenylyltransferase [Acinetobacter baumannii]
MSQKLFSLNKDLRQLREAGYHVQIIGGFLIMKEVPYVNAQKCIKKGTLVTSLDLAGDNTRKPECHVMHWDGEYPCKINGDPLNEIRHMTQHMDFGHGITTEHSFSSKPGPEGYPDYFAKMSTYATILSGPAAVLQPGLSPKIFPASDETESDNVFNYIDTASDRAGIGKLSEKLEGEVVSIIGTGGTGSYIVDLISKTPVREIRLFDEDEFLQHNAFRAPGAPSLAVLRNAPLKVDYLKGIYGQMHRNIVAYPTSLNASNLELLNGTTFAFICIDSGEDKKGVIQKLESLNVPFIDVGMGLELVNGSLGGILRVTTSTPERREHIHSGRVSFGGGDENDLYTSNIQVADLNSLNATLAVIKWKKIRGFYSDLEKEHHCTYTTDGNMLLNGDQIC